MKRNEINNIWMKAIERKELTAEEKAMTQIAYIENEIMVAALDRDNSFVVEITKAYKDTLEIVENHFKDNGFNTEIVPSFDANGCDYLLIEWN